MGGTRFRHGRDEKCLQNFDRKPKSKRPVQKPTCRWEDNIETDLKQLVVKGWTEFIWLSIGISGGLL